MAFTVSGTVAVREARLGKVEEAAAASADVTVIDVVILESYFWTLACEKARGKSVCVRAPVNALCSDCSPQSKSIYFQANSRGRESKQTHCLIRFGSQRVSAGGRLIL